MHSAPFLCWSSRNVWKHQVEKRSHVCVCISLHPTELYWTFSWLCQELDTFSCLSFICACKRREFSPSMLFFPYETRKLVLILKFPPGFLPAPLLPNLEAFSLKIYSIQPLNSESVDIACNYVFSEVAPSEQEIRLWLLLLVLKIGGVLASFESAYIWKLDNKLFTYAKYNNLFTYGN